MSKRQSGNFGPFSRLIVDSTLAEAQNSTATSHFSTFFDFSHSLDPFRHSALRNEIEMSATPGLSRECRFGKNGKLFQPFVTMKLAGLSFALSI
jgi:hypothetical protein